MTKRTRNMIKWTVDGDGSSRQSPPDFRVRQ
jgi:hypothetical protein